MKKALSFCLLLLLVACEKKKATDDDTAPVVIITSPTVNQTFTGGQTVSINATATDESQLKQMHLEIINATNGLVVKHEHYAVAAATYPLTQSFSAQSGTNYRIKVEADDAAGNTGRAEVSIAVN